MAPPAFLLLLAACFLALAGFPSGLTPTWTCAAAAAAAGVWALPNDIGVWEEATAAFVPSGTSLANGRQIVSQVDWDGSLNPGLLALAQVGDTVVVEYHSSRAASKRDAVFTHQWTLQPLPNNVSVVSAAAADLRRRGAVDLLLQGADGYLYVARHGPTRSGPPQAPRRLKVVTRRPRCSQEERLVTTRLRSAATPQVALALLASDYPSIVYVDENGALIELRWQGQWRRSSARGTAALEPEQASEESERDFTYEWRALVPADGSGMHAGESGGDRGVGAPALQLGVREVTLSSLAMADVNGDCAAELLYTVRDNAAKTLSLYAYQPFGWSLAPFNGTTHVKLFEFAEQDGERLGSLSVADVDGDGSVDFVFPWRDSKKGDAAGGYTGVMVFYGPTVAEGGCAGGRASPAFLEEAALRYNGKGDALVKLTEGFCGPERAVKEAEGATAATPLVMPDLPALPLILRTGDYNRDGHVDLVVPSRRGTLILTATGSRGGTGSPNTPPAFTCRHLSGVLTSPVDGDAVGVDVPFFAPVSEEEGRLDVVLTRGPVGSLRARDRNRVFCNAALPDRNYYVLVSALNGAAATASGGFALSQPGVVHYLAWDDARMRRRWRRVTQLAQYAGFALQPPRVLVGLGETFSYVRSYAVAVTAAWEGTDMEEACAGDKAILNHLMIPSTPTRSRQWPSYLVPNSQVFAVLDPPSEPSRWRLQMYLPTSRYKLLIGISLLVWLVALGIPIVCLRWRELRRDYREWRRSG